MRLEEALRGTRAPCFGDEMRQRAERARAMMAPAALQLVLLLRCPAFRALALLSMVALRHAIRGQSASVDAELAQRLGARLCVVRSRLGTVT